MIIYAAGNLLLDEDNIPIKILPRLAIAFPGVTFSEIDTTEDFPESKDLILIDTATGVNDVCVLDSIDKIEIKEKQHSLHDMDLGFSLMLMKKMGTLQSIKIICVPQGMGEDEAFEKVSDVIKKILDEM